jgi:hypothetical protein
MASKAMTMDIERITPTKAKDILENLNNNNRKLRQNVVERYTRDMKSNNWHSTGDPIRFDKSGNLLDGQHRLAAIIESKKPLTAIVIRNVDSESVHHIDTGAKRSFADALMLRGYKDVNQLAATIRWILQYEQGEILSRKSPTIAEMLNFLDNNPEVLRSAEFVRRKVPYFGLRTVLAGIHYFSNKNMPGEAEAFFITLRDGEDIKKNHPVHTLRTWLLRGMMTSKRPIPVVTQAVVIKAWNAYIEGREVGKLAFRPGGKNAEKFPEIRVEYP